jgi:hypothetical protein
MLGGQSMFSVSDGCIADLVNTCNVFIPVLI